MIKDYLDPDSVLNISFFESIKEIIICNICSGILINPRECSSCQNSFCKICLDEWTSLNNICPYKCEKTEFKDGSRTLKNLLEKLQLKCLFCDSPEFNNINYFGFISHLKTCEKIKVNCPTCDCIVLKKKLNENSAYIKLKENFYALKEKFKYILDENQKLKDDINYMKELQNEVPIKMISQTDGINKDFLENGELGIIDKCEHFRGNYIPIFSCCEKSFPCYICHNKYKDHEYKISNKVVCLVCKNIYSGPRCNVCNTNQIYRKK